jgi:hypothetical protein
LQLSAVRGAYYGKGFSRFVEPLFHSYPHNSNNFSIYFALDRIGLYKDGKVLEARVGLTDMEKIADNLVELLGRVEEKVKIASDIALSSDDDILINKIELNDLLKANERLDKIIKQQSGELIKEKNILHDFFMNAPATFSILKGPEHIIELANPDYIELVGGNDPTGKTMREAFPECSFSLHTTLKSTYLFSILNHPKK